MKPVHARAKRHTKILHPFSGSGSDVIFTAEAKDGGAVSGKIEERRKGMLGYKSKLHDLEAENRFRIGALTQGYKLSVIPDQDVVIGFQTSHTQIKDVLRWIGLFFAGMIGLAILMNLLGATPPSKE